jgi:protocatechuate 3,4-dioxygenase beta subunit
MKFLATSFLLLSLVLVARGQSARDAKSDLSKKDECSIAGMVVKLAGSEPLKNAKIQLRGMDDRGHNISIVTDAGGRFTLKGLPPGRYNLSASKNGFVDQPYGQRKSGDPGSVLTLHAGQDLRDLLFRLMPSAVISGRVLDDEGEPLPWAAVSAWREVYSEGRRKLSAEATFQTNDRGEFRIFGLPPGKYLISGSHRSGKDDGRVKWQEPEDSGAPDLGYIRLYYPGVADPARASSIVVRAGEEIPAVEFLLRKFRVYRVRGGVHNLTAVAPRSARISITLRPKSSLELDESEQLVSADSKDGSFEIRDVSPGSYVLSAQLFGEGKWHTAISTVEVVNADVDGLSVNITSGVTVSGKILWDGPAPTQDGELYVSPESVDRETGYFSGSNRVEFGNVFTWKDLGEATYRAPVWNLPKDCFLKDVRYAGESAFEDGFTVTRGAAASVEIILSSRGAHVQGVVSDADNLPAAGVWVVLVPGGRRSRFDLYKTQITDQYGHFDFRGLPPGDYKLFSWEEIEEYAWQDPEFLKPVEDQGQEVVLKEADQKAVNLTAIRTASAQQKP